MFHCNNCNNSKFFILILKHSIELCCTKCSYSIYYSELIKALSS